MDDAGESLRTLVVAAAALAWFHLAPLAVAPFEDTAVALWGGTAVLVGWLAAPFLAGTLYLRATADEDATDEDAGEPAASADPLPPSLAAPADDDRTERLDAADDDGGTPESDRKRRPGPGTPDPAAGGDPDPAEA